jgi:hypothetical protein
VTLCPLAVGRIFNRLICKFQEINLNTRQGRVGDMKRYINYSFVNVEYFNESNNTDKYLVKENSFVSIVCILVMQSRHPILYFKPKTVLYPHDGMFIGNNSELRIWCLIEHGRAAGPFIDQECQNWSTK